MTTRTITLTGRPPVSIEEEAWPMLASASDSEHDGQVECQANRSSKWFVGVRQHDDGRCIVYATYSYTSNWQGARGYSAKAGEMLTIGDGDGATPDDAAICEAIYRICGEIADAEHNDDDASRWKALCRECIADMPAEAL